MDRRVRHPDSRRQHSRLYVVPDGMPVDRKLNVAVTRARQQFFLVGNIPLLSLAPDYLQLVQYIGRLSDSNNK